MNPFESLCILASRENWCWKLFCTTCGHLHFRYAFAELAKGKSPDDSDWIIHSRKTNYSNKLGEWPRRFTNDQKEKVLGICSKADISLISSKCTFPDWLGYMGLILEDMNADSTAYRKLSASWAKQLGEMVRPDTEISRRLRAIVENEGIYLDIKDLERCESSLWEGNLRGGSEII